MMDNIFIWTDLTGNIMPDKIVGAMAVMALERVVRNGGSTGSMYDESEILSF